MTITPEHEQQVLLPRGITASQAEQYGARSIASTDELLAVAPQFEKNRYAATGSGLLFRWSSPLSGEVLQFRPDEPVRNEKNDPVRYVFPFDTHMVLNALRVGSPASPLLLQEGTMQSLAAAVYMPPEWAVYGMSGCWSWRKGDTQVATPDLLVVEGRSVIVSLDADAATNLDVYNAGMALRDALENEGAAEIRFLRLDGHGAKAGLDDVLGARPESTRAAYLGRLLEKAEEKPAKKAPARKKSSDGGAARFAPTADRPMIAVNDDRREVINQMTSALHQRFNSSSLFNYGGILAQRQGVSVTPVTEGVFADLIADAALCVTINSKGEATPGWPDEKSCKATLSRAGMFASLQRIAQVPFVRPDGSICQTSGYDAETATFLALDEAMEAADVSVAEEPSADEVAGAVKLLCEEWLGDLFSIMPGPEDRANCLALVLTPFIRGLVPLAPMAVVDGLQMGVGKNLLADVVSIVAHGVETDPLPYSRDDDENRKVITAKFRAGDDLFVFDEAHVIEGRQLAKSITSITYTDRILGVSNMIEFPNRVTWVALGNNVSVNGDLARRVYRIRLAPNEENPQDRDSQSFRHPNLRRWTKEHRPELVAACLTLIRAWFAGEREENAAGRRFGSFEAWGGMVGGVLDRAGVEGFLGSLVEWRSETDYETGHWSEHLSWLRRQFGEDEFTVHEVVKKMRSSSGYVEHPPRLEDHTVSGYNRVLGLAYKRVKNRYIAGMQLVKTREVVGHGSWWRVLGSEQGSGLDVNPTSGQASILSNGHKPRSEATLVTLVSPTHVHEEKSMNTCDSAYAYENASPASAGSNYLASPNQPERLARTYPMYPSYPSTDGADPLASLLDLAVDVPAPECPDCDQPEEQVPGAHWFACRTCHPNTFTTRAMSS